jgi:hypothetical protein
LTLGQFLSALCQQSPNPTIVGTPRHSLQFPDDLVGVTLLDQLEIEVSAAAFPDAVDLAGHPDVRVGLLQEVSNLATDGRDAIGFWLSTNQ